MLPPFPGWGRTVASEHNPTNRRSLVNEENSRKDERRPMKAAHSGFAVRYS
jgi:hypothetical protein